MWSHDRQRPDGRDGQATVREAAAREPAAAPAGRDGLMAHLGGFLGDVIARQDDRRRHKLHYYRHERLAAVRRAQHD